MFACMHAKSLPRKNSLFCVSNHKNCTSNITTENIENENFNASISYFFSSIESCNSIKCLVNNTMHCAAPWIGAQFKNMS